MFAYYHYSRIAKLVRHQILILGILGSSPSTAAIFYFYGSPPYLPLSVARSSRG